MAPPYDRDTLLASLGAPPPRPDDEPPPLPGPPPLQPVDKVTLLARIAAPLAAATIESPLPDGVEVTLIGVEGWVADDGTLTPDTTDTIRSGFAGRPRLYVQRHWLPRPLPPGTRHLAFSYPVNHKATDGRRYCAVSCGCRRRAASCPSSWTVTCVRSLAWTNTPTAS